MSFYLDQVVAILNLIFCSAIAAGLGWAVLSRDVNDGIIIKGGLISMSFGFAGIAFHLVDGHSIEDLIPVQRGMLMIHAGIGIVILGYFWKRNRARHPIRRKEDWKTTMQDTLEGERR